jgi:alpha-1,3-rhamnosyl/mannosyltransferase
MPAKGLRPLAEAVALPWAACRERLDVFHGTKQTLPAGLRCARVVTVHDLAPMILPATFSAAAGAWLRRSTAAAARRAHLVLADSETTARDLRERLGVPAERIRVVPLGIDARFAERPSPAAVEDLRRRYGLPASYVACVGTIQPRKNVDVVLDAMDLLAARRRDVPPLALAGRVGWMSEGVVARAKSSPRVRWLGTVPDADLPPLLAGASVFVSPSSYEGFGLAVGEAMAAGTAVVAGGGSASDEVVGDAGELVPPRDVEAVADAVERLLVDGARRARLAAAGRERALGFTWEATARATLAVYREAAERVAAEARA